MYAIVCMNETNGIGYCGAIPWKSREDMKHFKKMTIGSGNNAIVMGHNTFKSIGCKPLPYRKNYVMTHHLPSKETHPYQNESVIYVTSKDDVLLLPFLYEKVFIIGGQSIYKMFEEYYHTIYVTYINNRALCDTFFTVDLVNKYTPISTETKEESNSVHLRFVEYENNCKKEICDVTTIVDNCVKREKGSFQKYRDTLGGN